MRVKELRMEQRVVSRICVVSFCNIYLLPYAKVYIDTILQNNAKCTLLFWDRDAVNGVNDVFPGCEKFCYQRRITADSNLFEKIAGYKGAVSYFKDVIKKNKFDKLIFLQTHAAVACADILKNFTNRYIIDIRDWTLENFKLYKKLEKKCIYSSFATIISSPAYSQFLPAHDYIIAHNFTPFLDRDIEIITKHPKKNSNAPINISFVGTVRFINMDKKILTLFANDNRFVINYFGNGSDILKKFCEDNRIKNAQFHGSFSPELTISFYEKTDIINNLYGNHNKFLDYALSNKLYHAAQLQLPILVCPNTYMEEVTKKYGIGFVFDVNSKKSPDNLYKWYKEIDKKELADGCNRLVERVKKDNIRFYQTVKDFIYDQ